METRSTSRPVYVDINPRSEWVPAQEADMLLIDVSGFKKEQLKVQVDTSRNLKIRGECMVEGNRLCRFNKNFDLPQDCDVNRIRAKFDEGILYVIIPKPVTQVSLPEQDNVSTDNKDIVDDTEEEDFASKRTQQKPKQGLGVELGKHWKLAAIVILAVIVVVGLGAYAPKQWLGGLQT